MTSVYSERQAGGVLEQAGRAVVRESEARIGIPRPELQRSVDALGAAIREVVNGAPARLPPMGAHVPVGPLLDALRIAIVDAVAVEAEPDGRALVQMLRAIDALQQAALASPVHRMAAHFTGSDSLRAVVEVAHDMRSPLTSVLFLIDALRKSPGQGITAVQERQLGLIYTATFGLNSLANDLIELARGSERLIEDRPVAFSLEETIGTAVDIVRPMAEEKQLSINVSLPQSDYRLGHPLALGRVLLNLMVNALKFTATGGIYVSAVQTSRTTIEFAVRDSGVGIPPEVMPTLFDAFRRVEGGRAGGFVFSSAGLGLAICRHLVTGLGSELVVESEVGQGSKFRFSLDLPPARRI